MGRPSSRRICGPPCPRSRRRCRGVRLRSTRSGVRSGSRWAGGSGTACPSRRPTQSLARAAGRRREIAVRLAIGAGRARLVQQLLTETTILFAAGWLAGIALTRWLTALLLGVLPQVPLPLGIEIGIDWRVIAFATTLSLAAA